MVQKIQKAIFKVLISLTILFFAFALAMVGNAVADEPTELPKGEAPSIEATEVEQAVLEFREADDGPPLRPNHPPFDQIPPMPMPEPPETGDLPTPIEPGGGVYHNAITEETIILPVDAGLFGGFGQGGGYNGADGGHGGSELIPMTFYDMYQITNTGDFPWRMNCKLVMRFGSDWAVCSGTMRDAETVLTAGHCVYDYGGYGWADEIWVYPGWDGNDFSYNAENYGWAHSTYFGAGTNWVDHGDLDADVGLVGVTRGVGMITGWFGWCWGYSCDWHKAKTYRNASYPAECCNPPACTLHNGRDMYYWFGHFDSCPWNQLQIDTTGGCLNAGWGGMSGSGAYYIDGGNRYVHAVASTSDRATWARYCRQWEAWVNWSNDTFIPMVRGSAFDLQALDVNAEPATIEQGGTTTLLNHLATNPTNGSASGTWTFGVYLSTNDNISTADTLLSTQHYSWTFGAMSSARINMAPVTIPLNTPPGDYWLGVVYDSATDSNSNNNDTDGWDAVPIHVTPSNPDLTVTSVNAPSSAKVGDYIAVSWTVKNQGGAPSGSFYNRISLATTPYGTDISLGNYPMNSIGADSSLSDAQVPKIPEDVTPGYYYVTVFADAFDTVTESDENNNINKAPNQIHITSCTGTISVTSEPSGASFSLSGPASYSGKTPWSVSNAPVGTYTITWGAMSGYKAPPSESKTLSQDGTISFHGVYTPCHGTISVTSEPSGASFSLSGPASYSGTTPWSVSEAPVGTYTITWGAMSGYKTPPSESKTLSQDGTISFHGVYTPCTGTISVTSEPSGASFSLSGPASYSGTTTWSVSEAPVGTYTITWGAMSGYKTPPSESKTLSQDGSISFHGVYESSPSPPCRFYGTVKLNGENVPDGTVVTAWLESPFVGPWTTITFTEGGESCYVIDIPADDLATPEKDGGVEGDIVSFTIDELAANESCIWDSGDIVNCPLTGTAVVTSIDAPDEVAEGSDFIANVTVDYVQDFDSCGFDVTYDQSIITVTDITNGEINGHITPVDEWRYIPVDTVDTGRVRVIILMPGVPSPGVSGSGYIAQIHFHVLGSACNTSAINLENVGMYNWLAERISTTTQDDSVHVSTGVVVTDCAADPNPTKVGHNTSFSVYVAGGVTPYSYDWDFGDGNNSTAASPIHHYTAADIYTVTVNVTDSEAAQGSCSFNITVTDEAAVTVSIDAPAEVAHCTNFTARVNIANVTDLDTYQFKLSYDPTVLEVIGAEMGPEGVTDGVIDSTPISVDMWAFQPIGTPGVMMILGNVAGVGGASGTGYLCEVHFHVIGSACNTSALNFTEGKLFNCDMQQIPVDWINGSVHISTCEPGDANLDGEINMSDVTKVERIILMLDPPTPCADANLDGVIDMADVTCIEWKILGVD